MGVFPTGHKGVTGRGSPSLTSEVAADTKCRQELVEVISKPWWRQDGGLSRSLGVPRQGGHWGGGDSPVGR